VRLLDLFCGAGGAAMGYHRAGFDEIVGVDINPQPHYPFEFVQADALGFLVDWLIDKDTFPDDVKDFDMIHASPPCQDHSALKTTLKQPHGNGHMLADITECLQKQDAPWVIENVPGAPMRKDLVLCGRQFQLKTFSPTLQQDVWLKRHRIFQTNVPVAQPAPCNCTRDGHKTIGVYGNGDGGGRGWKDSFADRKAVMQIDWMNRNELSQAVPPAYTEYIGQQFLQQKAAA
jgi:DNA (cytosine-5)-methyltransferase 1